MERPSPVPAFSLSRCAPAWTNGLKMDSSLSFGMPTPVSCTSISRVTWLLVSCFSNCTNVGHGEAESAIDKRTDGRVVQQAVQFGRDR